MSTPATAPAPDTQKRYLSITEFAKLVGRSRQAVHRAACLGLLPGARRRQGPGRQPWFIPAECVAIYKDRDAAEVQVSDGVN